MAFVNEYATDEDIEKYDLNGIWDKYHPARKGKYFLGQRPAFTIDRERNIFFMPICQGREEHANRKTVLLWLNGLHVLAVLDLADSSSKSFKEVPYRMDWELVRVDAEKEIRESRNVIFSLLKEALVVYGYSGVRRQIPNTKVNFKNWRGGGIWHLLMNMQLTKILKNMI